MLVKNNHKKRKRGDNTPIDNLAPYLPAFFTITGEDGRRRPLNIDNHFAFGPLFSTHLPPVVVIAAGRQLGKTWSTAARLLLETALVPGHLILIVSPRQEQSDRVSVEVFKPLIEGSPIKSLLASDATVGSVRRRLFSNHSGINFSYAFLDAERVRGMTCRWLYIDEAQDFDGAHYGVLDQCMSSYSNPLLYVTGSSKTKDTFLAQRMEKTSQAVWQIVCDSCGFDNICCLEPEGHLISLIGPMRDDISEERPGTVCNRCRNPIRPRAGRWVHRRPELIRDAVGYHIPQIIMPHHYAYPLKWKQLVAKMNGEMNYTTGRFYNEVLGEPYDMAYKLVGRDDLKIAAKGVGPNTEANAAKRTNSYRVSMLGVDWGGGGSEGVSRTKICATGLTASGKTEVYFGAQLPPGTDQVAEAKEVLRIAKSLGVHYIAHDANGAGATSESVLTHLGWPVNRIIPMVYAPNVGGDMVAFKKPNGFRLRGYYVMDKGRSLQFTCMAIRAGRMKFFDYDYVDADRPGLLEDFTVLVADTIDTATGEVYRIRKAFESQSDDFAHAVNYSACAIWEMCNAYPDLSTAGRI